LSFGNRWRAMRVQYALPNLVIAAAVVGIVIVVLIAGVKRGYLNEDTAIFLVCFIPTVMFHEVAHGVVALWCGDDTAKQAKRLSLNPLRHIDPVGSIAVPLLFALAGHPPFGWAKPVPVRIDRLRSPRNQAVLVGLAGPATNLILMVIGGVAFHFAIASDPHYVYAGNLYVRNPLDLAARIALDFGVLNIVIAVFNLIPIPPLDGSALIERLLPASALPQYYRMRFGFIIVVLFLVLFDQSFLQHLFGYFESWFNDLFAR
jgi:Zn-dependent protease